MKKDRKETNDGGFEECDARRPERLLKKNNIRAEEEQIAAVGRTKQH